MTNVTAPWEGDHCSRAVGQRFIKYIKTSWILSAPLAQNKAEGSENKFPGWHWGLVGTGEAMSLPAPSLRPLHPKGARLYKCSGAMESIPAPLEDQQSIRWENAWGTENRGVWDGVFVPHPRDISPGSWEPELRAGCEMSGEVSAPGGTEGFLLPARNRFGWSRGRAGPCCQSGDRAVSGWPRGSAARPLAWLEQ